MSEVKEKKKRGIKPSSAKAKGRNFQQYVRDKLRELHPSLDPDDIRSTSMGAPGEDIQLSPAARKLIPLSFECKHRANYAFYKDYDQAVNNAPTGVEPILVVRANHRPAVAIIDYETFLEILKESNWRKSRRGTRK